jgi:mono/diheme cytochrome c family protein
MLPGDLSGISLNDLRNGRKLYVQNCGGCHRLKPPQEQTDSQWIESYAKMRTRVELNRSEEERLLAYLRAFAKRPYPSDSTR